MSARMSWLSRVGKGAMLVAAFAMVSLSQVANAGFVITPTSSTKITTTLGGIVVGASNDNDVIKQWTGLYLTSFGVTVPKKGNGDYNPDTDSTLLYKKDFPTDESGWGKNYYSTVFDSGSISGDGPFKATITNDGANSGTGLLAIVKDGNHSPAWYAFDISAWNGKEQLVFDGFWGPNMPGAISHVALYGGNGFGSSTPVPEPLTAGLMLSGMALSGFVLRRRRK